MQEMLANHFFIEIPPDEVVKTKTKAQATVHRRTD